MVVVAVADRHIVEGKDSRMGSKVFEVAKAYTHNVQNSHLVEGYPGI